MFDRTNAAHLASLKSEVLTDPAGLGYNPGSTTDVLKLINDQDGNPTGATTNVTLTPGILLAQMVPDDLDAQQVGDGERRYVEAFLNRDFDADIEAYRSQIISAFKANSTTVSNINALIRSVSRAEELFGVGAVISRDDWLAARDS